MTERKPAALKLVIDGVEREVSYEQLTLSNNLAQEALVRVLVEKGIVDPKELLEAMQKVKAERFKTEGGDAEQG